MGFSTAMMSGFSGLQSNSEAITVIGNNIANVNTVGFKSGRMLFSDVLAEPVAGNNSQVGLGVQISSVENIFSQGTLSNTANATDIAIGGNGFFVVQDNSPTPATFFTRAGAFTPDSKGTFLVNPDGAKLCDSAGAPINLTTLPKFDRIDKINQDGSIRYLDTTGAQQLSATRIGVASFFNPAGLDKVGNNLYQTTLTADGSGAAVVAVPDQDNRVYSFSLEESNVDMANQMVNMIVTQRAYSANSKTIATSDEMTQTVINMKR
jgi:flagellar hook protein FlgE